MDKNQLMRLISQKITFSREEIDAAEAEMHRDRKIISAVARDGINVGLTANKTGTQYFCGYAEGFNLGTLNTYDGGETFVMDGLQIPPWLLDAIGTPLEAPARKVALDWSVSRVLDDAHFEMLDVDGELNELRRRISAQRMGNNRGESS